MEKHRYKFLILIKKEAGFDFQNQILARATTAVIFLGMKDPNFQMYSNPIT